MAKRPVKKRPAKSEKTSFRVYRIPRSLKDGVAKARMASGETVEVFVNSAVENHLAVVVEDLGTALGPKATGETTPVRMPLRPATLKSLATASEQTGLAGSQLLLACLARTAQGTISPRRRRKKNERGLGQVVSVRAIRI